MKRIVSSLLAVMILAAMLIMPAAVFAEDEYVDYEEKNVTAYMFNSKTKKTFSCLFREDMKLPFINAADYLNQIYTESFKTTDNEDGTYTISNKNGKFVVDPEKDTVHFDSFEKLVYFDAKPTPESKEINYLDNDEFVLNDKKQKGLDLDLGKYNIDITENDGKVYFPLTTIADIFSASYQTAVYIGGNMYFSSITDEKPYYSDDPFFASVERDSTLINYTYNELCFVVDNLYGKPQKAEIAESIKKKGFDKSLDEYSELTKEAKKLLKSKNKTDYCFGLLYLDTVFDDGGHTSFGRLIRQSAEAGSDTALGKALTKALSDTGDKRTARLSDYFAAQQADNKLSAQIKETREKAYSDYDKVKDWSENNFLLLKDKTVIFVFNGFDNTVVEPFIWSLDYAQKKGAENFVIDISANGGGLSSVAIYMLSVITGSGDLSMKNFSTGNSLTEKAAADKNLDGKFDSNDDGVKYDFNYAILTSQMSYSSANLMAGMAKERGVKILGETSGGGACMLLQLYYPEAASFTLSSTLMMVDKDGSDIDGGVKPDVELVTKGANGTKDYSGLYNVENISAALKGEPATQSHTEAAETKTEKSAHTDPGIPYYIWILIGVGAVIGIVELIIYLYRRRKYN